MSFFGGLRGEQQGNYLVNIAAQQQFSKRKQPVSGLAEKLGGKGYAGDKSPKETWDILVSHQDACLIDVRSQAEWGFVGICDLSSIAKKAYLIPLMTFPGMQNNEHFTQDLAAQLSEQGIGKEAPLLFICRSGQRSIAAAKLVTAAGFTQCLNVLEGFEGDLDAQHHRGQSSGWKVSGLPWTQQ